MAWRVDPEVAGRLGEHTEMTTTVHPPLVTKLHYQFEGWLGDELLTTFPCFLVTDRLAAALVEARLTGFTLADVEVSTSERFDELHPGLSLPGFRWLQVGRDENADLHLASDHHLVVSTEALSCLRRHSISHAVLQPMRDDAPLLPGVVRVAHLDVDATAQRAARAGYTVFALSPDGITDRSTFFDAVRATLPLDPPVVSARSWDAMSDSLWEGLHQLPGPRIVILWPNARVMAHEAPDEHELALQVLADVAETLADDRATLGHPKTLSVVVES